MHLHLKPGTSWSETYARCQAVAPEAFDPDRISSLLHGEWRRVGIPDDVAVAAVEAACAHHAAWGEVDLDERRARVTRAVDAMTVHREPLAMLLVWEIGKPWRLACADVGRAPDGVRWCVEHIERQLDPSGPRARRPSPARSPTSRAGTTR